MQTDNKKGITTKNILLLHFLLAFYSLGGIFSKRAAGTEFLSLEFFLNYGMVFVILGVYAIGWQQIIKRLPLSFAFANKAVTVVWGIVWGALFFSEPITVGKIVGACIIIAGIVLFATSEGEDHVKK